MSKIKSLAAQSAAAGGLFLDHLNTVVANPSDPLPLRAAALVLRRPVVVAELRRKNMEIKPALYTGFEACLRAAVAENNPTLMHYTTALMAALMTKKIMSEADFGPLVTPAALETYHAFSARIPKGLTPKGPLMLKTAILGPQKKERMRALSEPGCVVPDLLAPSPLVRGRDKAFSGRAYGGYTLALLQAVEADPTNTPLLTAAFSGVSWELARLNQKKEAAEALPQLPEIAKTLERIVLAGIEKKNPFAVHHSLKAITFMLQHAYIEPQQCSALTSSQAVLQIGHSIKALSAAGYTGRAGLSGQGLFLSYLKECGVVRPAAYQVFLSAVKHRPHDVMDTPSEAFAKSGVLKAVAITFDAATRFKRAVPLCQLQALASDVGQLAVEALDNRVYSWLSSSVVAMGALMAAHKSVRPSLFKEAVTPRFVSTAFERVAQPVLQHPDSVDAKNVMRFFLQLDSRRLLPEAISSQVKVYKAEQRMKGGLV